MFNKLQWRSKVSWTRRCTAAFQKNFYVRVMTAERRTIGQYVCLISSFTYNWHHTLSGANHRVLDFSESMPTRWWWKEWVAIFYETIFCFQSHFSITADPAAQKIRKCCISLIHLQSVIELKALQRCILAISMLKHQSQKQNIKSWWHAPYNI